MITLLIHWMVDAWLYLYICICVNKIEHLIVYFQYIDSRVKTGNKKDDLFIYLNFQLLLWFLWHFRGLLFCLVLMAQMGVRQCKHTRLRRNSHHQLVLICNSLYTGFHRNLYGKNIDYFETIIIMVFYVVELN